MEAFTLLKYWRPSDTAPLTGDTTSNPRATRNDTIATPAASDEPYFDLEFTPPTDDDDDTGEAAGESPEIDEKSSVNTETESGRSSAADELPDQETDDEEEEELKFAVKSGENNVIISPSSIIAEDHNSKLPASLLKSATKFRVLLLKLKKTKSSNKSDEKRGSNNLFIEFDVDEVKGPLISLFARDNTTKANSTLLQASDSKCAASNDERNLTKEMVHKYLKMLKPIRVPGRHVEKMKFSVTGGSSSSTAAAGVSPPELRRSNLVNVKKTPHQNQGGNTSNTRRKHLGKSRSSSAMVVAPPPSGGMGSNRRRDDSLLQQEDGIRGAILHCKRSFNGTRDGESAVLSRSVSDPSYNI